jgi:hypothetical protein
MNAADSTWCRDYEPDYRLHGCELDAGHPGPHRDLLGNEWEETLPPEPWRCDANWGTAAGRGQQCLLGTGHDGLHRDQHGNKWGEPERVRKALAAARTTPQAEEVLDGMSKDDLLAVARDCGIAARYSDSKEIIRHRIADGTR